MFMVDNGIYLDEKEFNALFRRLDQDLDGKISYSEFLGELFTPSPTSIPTTKQRLVPDKMPSDSSPLKSGRLTFDIYKQRQSPQNNEKADVNYDKYFTGPTIRSFSPERSLIQERETYKTPDRSATKPKDSLSSKKKSPLKGSEEEELVRALREIINHSKQLENTKNELALRSEFNHFDAFRVFDVEGRAAFISFKDFKDGLTDLNIFYKEEELQHFFRRFDTDSDSYLR